MKSVKHILHQCHRNDEPLFPDGRMATFHFFLKDETIREVEAVCLNEAMRKLCQEMNKSWIMLFPEILDILTVDPNYTLDIPV
jgi:hypothetical protein